MQEKASRHTALAIGDGSRLKWTKRDIVYLVFVEVLVLTFNLLLFNKYAPVTEGWFQVYATDILSGKVPYRDFYLYIPPLFPYLMSVVSLLGNNAFIVLRIYGMIERMMLIGLAFSLLRRYFPGKAVFFSLLVSSIVYISNLQDVFYGYYQTTLLLSFFMLYTVIRMYDNFEQSRSYNALIFGLVAALTTLTKHVTGIILFIALMTVFFFITFRKNRSKSITQILIAASSLILFTVVALIPFAVCGALQPMVQQLFVGASSKGSMGSILFGFWGRIVTPQSVLLACCMLVAVVLNLMHFTYSRKRYPSNTAQYKLSYGIALLGFAIGLVWPGSILLTGGLQPFFAGSSVKLFVLCVCLLVCIILFAIAGNNRQKQTAQPPVDHPFRNQSDFIVAGALIGLLCAALFYLATHNIVLFDFEKIRGIRQPFHYAIFFMEVLASLALFVYGLWKHDHRFDILLLICVAAWGIMYIHGMSGIIEDHGMLLSLSLALGLLLSITTVLDKLGKGLVYATGVILVLCIFTQRAQVPYYWWGVNATAPIYQATQTYADPILKGMYGSEASVNALDEIYAIVEENKSDSDTMYTFPHICYFNIMAQLPYPTFAAVHYFDVCPDDIAEADAIVLLDKKPEFIVWMELTEAEWKFHEDYFRAGAVSGQRALQAAYATLTTSGDYELLWQGSIEHSDPVYLWMKIK